MNCKFYGDLMISKKIIFPKIVVSKIIIIPLLVIILVDGFVNWARGHENVHINYAGFAVDSTGNLYLGVKDNGENRILVLDPSGDLLRSFDVPTNRGYSFTIFDKNQIVVDTGTVLYTLDTYGKVIDKSLAEEQSQHRVPPHFITHFTDSNGINYEMRGRFSRTRIIRIEHGQETVFYEMPLFDAFVQSSYYLSIIFAIIMFPLCIWRTWKLSVSLRNRNAIITSSHENSL